MIGVHEMSPLPVKAATRRNISSRNGSAMVRDRQRRPIERFSFLWDIMCKEVTMFRNKPKPQGRVFVTSDGRAFTDANSLFSTDGEKQALRSLIRKFQKGQERLKVVRSATATT